MGCRGERGEAVATPVRALQLPCCPSARPNRCSLPHAATRSSSVLVAAIGLLLAGAAPAGAQAADPRLLGSAGRGLAADAPDAARPARSTNRSATRRSTVACNGDPWAEPNIGRPQLSTDRKTVTVAVNTPMPTGPCSVAWSVRQPNGDDGPTGQFGFTVLTSPTPAGGSTATTTPGDTTPPATTAPAASSSGSSDEHRARRVRRLGRRDVARPDRCRRSAWPCCSARSC